MRFTGQILDGIVAGTVTVAFRSWTRPRVRPGTRLRTAVGVVAVEEVRAIDPRELTEEDARAAGHADLAELRSWLGGIPDGTVYRMAVRHAGADPRIDLRGRADLSDEDVTELRGRLDRLDRASKHGPWTRWVLRLIAERPGVRAADLAVVVERYTPAFKADVRKLKELGLTESLEVGYRLSPRGEALLARLGR